MNVDLNDIYFKPFEVSDINNGNYKKWFIDSEANKYNTHGYFVNNYTAEALRDFALSLKNNASRIVWAIYLKETHDDPLGYGELERNVHIGNCSIQSINFIDRKAEIAFIIDPEYWGLGIAARAGKFLLKHVFDNLNLNKIYLGCVSENIGMNRVAEKLGMKKEAVFLDDFYKNGRYYNINRYCIFKNEWRNDE